MLDLHVEIEPSSGFCFGVRKAIKKAEKILEQGQELYSLGEIVHNEQEIERLENKGMKTINREDFQQLQNKTVLFRAHGEPPESYEIAKKNKINVIDASCPIILKLQERIEKSSKNDEKIFIFGVPNHPEIVGLNGKIGNKAIVFDKFEDLDISKLPNKLTLYSQTTKSLKLFYTIIDRLKELNIEVNVVDSICRQVSNREQELRNFCRSFDTIVFVSGKNSSNGRQLFEICRQENNSSFFISSVNEIKSNWFKEKQKIGICGATSTPFWLIEEVKNHLLSF